MIFCVIAMLINNESWLKNSLKWYIPPEMLNSMSQQSAGCKH